MKDTENDLVTSRISLEHDGFAYEKRGGRFYLFVRGVPGKDYGRLNLLKGAVTRIRKREENYTKRKCMCCQVVFPSWGIGNRMCELCRGKTEGLI